MRISSSVTKRHVFFKFYYTSFHPGPVEEEDAPYNLAFLKELKLKVLEDMKNMFETGITLGFFVDIDSEYLAATLFRNADLFLVCLRAKIHWRNRH